MTNENKRPWYKNPTIIIPAIIGVIGILVTIILNLPDPEFEIYVNPIEGTAQQGGVITTTITVKGEHGYKEPVSLSASGQPSGVIVTFVPPIGGPEPTFTSNVIINIGSDTPIGRHEITINGVGADGKERSCKYILNVMPRQITPPPTPTPTFQIKIIDPKGGDEVPVFVRVRGSFSGELPQGQYMWIVINPHQTPGLWWPQEGRIIPKAQWEAPVWLGSEKEDIGKKFDIAVILVDEKDDQYYRDYLRKGQATGSFPGIPLPSSAKIIDRITVVRKSEHTPTKKVVDVQGTFFPSGWMGDWGDITLDDASTDNPYSGQTCIKITYSAAKSQGEGWAGIYWQYPDKNWGDKPEGRNLTGASKVTFWARGEKGGEKAEFKVGGITGKYPDSIQPPVSTGVVVLSNRWQQYTIDLTGKDLSHVIGGFCWVTNKNQNPRGCTIYLDDIRYE